jgi:hypothetical protein
MSNQDSRPLGDHDERQVAYRGGIADGTGDGTLSGGRDLPAQTAPRQEGQGLPDADVDDRGADRSGQTQPNFGQAGTYAATGEHAGGAHGRAATGGYHEDAGGGEERDDDHPGS